MMLVSKFRKPAIYVAGLLGNQVQFGPGARELSNEQRHDSSPTASCGEGELLNKRTERGYVTGSGINTSQPNATEWLRRSWAFLPSGCNGGKGANAPEFTSVHEA
jgi:hypothetical protein